MATTGIVNSTLIAIKVGSTLITCQTDATVSMTQEFRDTTCKDSSSWSNILPAKRSWEMSGSALFSYDGAYNFSALFALYSGQTSSTVKWGTTVSGDKIYSGSAYLSSLSGASSGSDENVTCDFTFTGSGAIAESTNP